MDRGDYEKLVITYGPLTHRILRTACPFHTTNETIPSSVRDPR